MMDIQEQEEFIPGQNLYRIVLNDAEDLSGPRAKGNLCFYYSGSFITKAYGFGSYDNSEEPKSPYFSIMS